MYPYMYRRESSDGTYETYEGEHGPSVRDGFAMAITRGIAEYPDETAIQQDATTIYDFAQALTDEKLRRDKADRDEGKVD